MLALIILPNLFLTHLFIALTFAQLRLKFAPLLNGPGMMRSSLITKAMLVCLMVFGTFLDVYGEIFVIPSLN
eukprot:2181784-Amphidinium_carterae.1